MRRVLILTLLLWPVCADTIVAQRPARKTEWQLQQERLEQARLRAMAEDGLGETIVVDSPRGSGVLLYRTGYNPPTWGINEPRGDVMGPWPAKVSVSWAADGTGRLAIESLPLYSRSCWFDGTIATDKVTVVGEARCDNVRSPFVGRINRGNKCQGFDGRWGGRGGPMTLTVSKDQVVGTYGNGGEIAGMLTDNGRTLEGQWMDASGRGRLRFMLAGEGESFHGTWANADGTVDQEPWNGSCAGRR